MTTQFHLSFPVTSLDRSVDFYQRCLGAQAGRRQEHWCDVLLFEHQLTLHERPADVPPPESHGIRHFGVNLGWAAFLELANRVRTCAAAPDVTPTERPGGVWKLVLRDPDGYAIEFKAVRDDATAGAG